VTARPTDPSRPLRLTRAESQALTRSRLVAVARDLFLREGYAKTSLERVAEEAGFSKGAVYSNFGGKDDLCLAVLDSIQGEVADAVLHALGDAASFEEALSAFDLWADKRLGDPDWSALEAEFAARSRRDPVLRHALRERNARLHTMLAGALAATADRHQLAFRLPVEEAAHALLSMAIGLGLQRAITPALEVGTITDVARALVEVLPDQG
jgi:AcrR family transcriptional regulator